MIKLLRGLGAATLGLLALMLLRPHRAIRPKVIRLPPAQRRLIPRLPPRHRATQPQGAPNQPQASNPVCVRLESQLATINSGSADPAHADQIKHAEDAIAKQQADLDRTLAQAHKLGCAGEGFFALFSGLSPQCGPLTSQIQQMRGNLDRMMSDLEQLKSGSVDQQAQRRALIGQLAQNNCGEQYTAAAKASGPAGFFEALFGGGTSPRRDGDGAPAGTYHTVCVRTCDGYYFPISYSTVPSRFPDDEHTCQRLCPAAEVSLYSYRNPGEDMSKQFRRAGSLHGAAERLPLSQGSHAKLLVPQAGRELGRRAQNADDSTTLESSDIVVTDKNAKALSQAPQGPGATPAPNANAAADKSASAARRNTPDDRSHNNARSAFRGTHRCVSGRQ